MLEILKEQTSIKMAGGIKDDAALVEDLRLDELDLIELVMSLEEEFGVAITDDEGDEWKYVKDVVSYMVKKVGSEEKK